MEKIEIIIQQNGTLIERTINERNLNAEQTVLNALTEDVCRSVRHAFNVPEWGSVHASVGLKDIIWSVPINRIPLYAKFRPFKDIVVPVFASTTDEIEMPLIWKALEAVRVVFVILTEDLDGRITINGNWLFALDCNKRAYRLPLPNLHDDCRICTGEFNFDHDTAFQSIQASLEQFSKSKWNADLMRTIEQSQKFFRFRPTNETFETLPVDAPDWTTLCEKVSTTITERIIL